jgi:cytochrome c oxidase subunit II
MKKLLIVLIACVAMPAWGQPAGSGAPPAAGSAAPAPVPDAGSGSAAAAPTPAPAAPAADPAAEAPKPPEEYPLEPGAIESKVPGDRCADLKHKPWYEQLACRSFHHEGTYWMPKSANKEGRGVDTMFYAVLALSIFFFIAITVVTVYFVWRYRGRKGHRAEPSSSHNDTLEITWTVIPTIITVFLFYYGWRGYINMVTPPVKAVEVQVTAQKWSWTFTHSNGVSDANLHVPVDTPVRLVMTSTDVLHSFFVPALRTKQDLIPRRYTYAWFLADKPGTYRLYCTEFCGTDHSQMKVVVVVHTRGNYERYLAERALADTSKPLDEVGADQYIKRGCNNCHTLDGSAKVGPTFKDDFGSEITVQPGNQKIKVDENYIRESLMTPSAKWRPEYSPSTMPPFAGQLKDRQVQGLIEFIKKQSKFADAPPSK